MARQIDSFEILDILIIWVTGSIPRPDYVAINNHFCINHAQIRFTSVNTPYGGLHSGFDASSVRSRAHFKAISNWKELCFHHPPPKQYFSFRREALTTKLSLGDVKPPPPSSPASPHALSRLSDTTKPKPSSTPLTANRVLFLSDRSPKTPPKYFVY